MYSDCHLLHTFLSCLVVLSFTRRIDTFVSEFIDTSWSGVIETVLP